MTRNGTPFSWTLDVELSGKDVSRETFSLPWHL